MASGPINSWEIDGKTVETVADFIFLGSKITADGDCSHEIKTCLLLWRKVMTNLDSILKSRDNALPIKVHLVKAMIFLQYCKMISLQLIKKKNKWEIWALKNWCFWTVVWEKTPESPLDSKEIQPVHPKGDLSWVFTGRTDIESETPVLWPPYAKNWLIWKDPDANTNTRLKAGGKGDDRVWDGWIASPTQWTWVWVNSGSC